LASANHLSRPVKSLVFLAAFAAFMLVFTYSCRRITGFPREHVNEQTGNGPLRLRQIDTNNWKSSGKDAKSTGIAAMANTDWR
jgi:hypothetical protein